MQVEAEVRTDLEDGSLETSARSQASLREVSVKLDFSGTCPSSRLFGHVDRSQAQALWLRPSKQRIGKH